MKRKSIHTYLDYELVDKIEKLSVQEKISINLEYEKILNIGLNYLNIDNKYDSLLSLLIKNKSNINYITKLLEQLYSDIGMPLTHPELNANLNSFKEKYRKGKNNLND